MKNRTHHQSETGQIIIIIAFLMIAMIAMLGLAIDGGGLMLLQRDIQNASDSAITAAVYAQCSGGNATQITNAALDAAKKQGYDNADPDITVTVDPNFSPPGGGGSDKYVRVDITAPKPTFFIQILYTQPLKVTAGGVGRCVPASSTSTAFTLTDEVIVSLGSTCSWDVNSTGATQTFNGSVYSNGNLKFGGSSATVNGTVTYTGTLNGSPTINPVTSPVDTNNPLPLSEFPKFFDVNDYIPTGPKAVAAGSDYYSYTSSQTFKDVTMEGLYYVDGDVTLNKITVGPKGLTIVLTGSLSQQNNIKNQNFAPYVDDLNFFTTEVNYGCNSSAGLQISGSDNTYSGVMYAPDSTIKMSGSTQKACQLIGYYINPSASDSTWGGSHCTWTPPPPTVTPPSGGYASQ